MDGDFVSGSGGVAVQRSAFVVPALRKEREGWGTLDYQSADVGQPPTLD